MKENLSSQKEEIEELIIDNLKIKKSIYLVYIFFVGLIFLYSMRNYSKYPLDSKEYMDSYFMIINSLNAINAMFVIYINKKLIFSLE